MPLESSSAGPEREGRNDPDFPESGESGDLDFQIAVFHKLGEQALLAYGDGPILLFALSAECCNVGKFATAEWCATTAIRCAEAQKQSPQLLCDLYLQLVQALNGLSRHQEALMWAEKAYELADAVPLPLLSSAHAAVAIMDTLAALGREKEVADLRLRYQMLFRGFVEERLGPGFYPEARGEEEDQ